MIAIRLRAYSPGTDTHLGWLPDPVDAEASFVHNGDGALTITYSTLADGGAFAARTLNQGLDIGVELNFGAGWVEPDGGRFLLVERDLDPADPAGMITLKLVSWGWLLAKVRNLNTAAVEGPKSKYSGQRKMANRDAGDIVKTFLDEHDGRAGPAVPVVRDSWTTGHDSAGTAWAKKKTLYYDLGQDLHSILDALVTAKLCDWRTRGRALRMYNPSGASADLSATIRLVYGDDLTEAPSTESQADRVARVLVKGDGKHKVTVRDPDIPELYGRWEGFIDSGGTKDEDALEDDGQAELDERNRIRAELTRGLTWAGLWLPLRDYGPGDWVTAPGSTSAGERLRVQQVTLTWSAQHQLSGNIVLGDRFTAHDLALAATVSAVTGGSSGVTGGGTTGADDGPDNRQPAAPTGVTGSGALYLADRRWAASLTASWSAVTTASDGTALDVARYQVWAQPQTTPASEWRLLTEVDGLTVTVRGLTPGAVWLVAVRAVGVTTTEVGVQSAIVSVTLPVDTAPPSQPSAPEVGVRLGVVTVGWDGLAAGGGAMEADTQDCLIYMSTTSGFTPGTGNLVGVVPALGRVPFAGLPAGTPQYVKLRARDYDGNLSAGSAQATGTPQLIVASDLGVALPGDVAFSDVNNLVPDGSFESSILRAARLANPAATGTWTADSTGAAHGTWALKAASSGVMPLHGVAQAAAFLAYGKLYLTARVKGSATAGSIKVQVRFDGAAAVDVATAATGTGAWQLLEGVVAVPAGTAAIVVQVAVTGWVSGSWLVDAVRCLQVVPTALIEDAAITTAKIADLAVNSAKIADLEVGKLTGGVLDVDVSVTGSLQTRPAGATDSSRVAMSGGTITIFGADGTPETVLKPGKSQFRGDATLEDATVETLTVSDHVTIEKGATVTLAAGVTAPGVAPVVDSVWPTVALKDATGAQISPTAVARGDDGYWYAMRTGDPGGLGAPTYFGISRHAADGSQLWLATGTGMEAFTWSNSMAVRTVSGEVEVWWPYLNGAGEMSVMARRISAAGVYNSAFLKAYNLSAATWALAGAPVVSFFGSALAIAFKSSSTSREIWRTVNTDTSAIIATVTSTSTSADTPATPKGAAITQGDWGADTYLFGHAEYFRATLASGAASTGRDFAAASADTIAIGYDGSGFWSADSAGVIYRHDGPTWTSGTPQVDAAYSNYDANATGGTHETGLSPSRTGTLLKRARVRVSIPGWTPDGSGDDTVNALRVYAGTTGGTLYLAGTITSGTSVTFAAVPTSGTTNTPVAFPASTPSDIHSADGSTVLAGDGAVRLLGVDWGKVPKTAFTTTSGAHGAAGSGWYRQYGPIVVLFWLGSANVAQNGQVTLDLSSVLPTALRPAETIVLACSGGSTGDRAANGQITSGAIITMRQQYSTAVAVQCYGIWLK